MLKFSRFKNKRKSRRCPRGKNNRLELNKDSDIRNRVLHLIKILDLNWLQSSKIFCVRSQNSKSRAHARIWGLSRIWQIALNTDAAYIIEVLSEKFDKLSEKEKDKVLLHELAHIPKNFSGSLLPHIRKRGKRNFNDRVNQLYSTYKKRKKGSTVHQPLFKNRQT